ncbi:MAG: HAD-IC family P-type ATPase, partial [Deltaproteobacteria bacterium]|nr:HAD-IC family P-type ATPase [Deltaproteobacteria bacterium]
MDISSLLKAVTFDIKARDHETVIKELSARLLPRDALGEAVASIKDHEGATGVLSETDSAVFHCLSEDVRETVVAVAVSGKGVRRSGKKRPERVFFLLISPIKESGSHLQMLSKIEGLLLDRAFHHAILNAKSEDEVVREIRKAEGAARSLYIPLQKEEVFTELDTSDKGLTVSEAQRRLKLTGPNTLKRIEKGVLLKDFLYNLFFNLFAVLLWAGGAMSFAAGMPELGWAIFLVIIINALFSFWQEYRAERAVEALKKLLPKKVRVIRDAAEQEIDAVDLVPGDLITLSEGDSVPADGRLVDAQAMRVDNSVLTGESKPVYKVSEPVTDGKGFIWTEVPNLVFAGTTIVSGSGSLVVTATGMDTEIGRVAFLTQAIKPEMSPLQKEISSITRTVTLIAVTLGLVFFLLGYQLAGLTFAESFIFAIGIIVANVPEGLLPTVSLSLAMGVQRMAARNAIVKKLSAVETLGSATVICTDKTGTLTTNRMNVVKLFVNGKVIEVGGMGYGPAGEFTHNGRPLSKEDLEKNGALKLLTVASLCNNATLRPPSEGEDDWTISGDPTEGALLTAAAKAGLKLDELKERYERTAHLPFERIRKRMSTVHDPAGRADADGLFAPPEQGRSLAFVKGAPAEVLKLSAGICRDGGAAALEPGEKEEILRQNDRMAAGGLRVLAMAYREVKSSKSYMAEEVEGGLTFIGLAAMLDPPRPEVKKAIEDCGSAGIKVVMVTGDYGLTAKAIGEQIGLGADRVVTGEELNQITHRALSELLKKGPVIFARVEPKDKLRVVRALQDNG